MQVVQQASVHMLVDKREGSHVGGSLPSSGFLCVNWMVCSARLLPHEQRVRV